MSREVAGEDRKSLGQFATNYGFAELRAATSSDPVISKFFDSRESEDPDELAKALKEFAKDASSDNASTAQGLADLVQDQKKVYICDGAGNFDEDEPISVSESEE